MGFFNRINEYKENKNSLISSFLYKIFYDIELTWNIL